MEGSVEAPAALPQGPDDGPDNGPDGAPGEVPAGSGASFQGPFGRGGGV
jgi:hypothetical protein